MDSIIILTEIYDIDKIIIGYLDLESISKLTCFKNTRMIILELFPRLVYHILDHYPKNKMIDLRSEKMSDFSNDMIMKNLIIIVLQLLSYHELNNLKHIDQMLSDLFKINLCNKLLSCLFMNIFNKENIDHVNNEICLAYIYDYYIDRIEWDIFVNSKLSVLFKRGYFSPEIFILSYKAHGGNIILDTDIFRYLNTFLNPAIIAKNKVILDYIIDYWRNVRDDFNDIQLRNEMDNIIIDALKQVFTF